MAIRPEVLDLIQEALDRADGVDPSDIDLELDGDAVVLRGAVSTFEEASAAALLAEEHASAVRNELRIDPNLRENPVGVDSLAVAPEPGGTPAADAEVGQPDDLVTDVGDALAENVPWEPPDEPTFVPTLAEERGVVDHDVVAVEPADAGPLSEEDAEGVEPSLPDLSAEELRRAARPAPRDDDRS